MGYFVKTTGIPLALVAVAVLSLFVPFRSVELTSSILFIAGGWFVVCVPLHAIRLVGYVFGRGFRAAQRDSS